MAQWNEIPDDIAENRIHDQTASGGDANGNSEAESTAQTSDPIPPAQGLRHQPNFRSKTEKRFSRLLRACEEVEAWWYEPVSFRVGDKRHYRPDFQVLRTGGGIELIEIKGGYTWDRALVKPSAAAELYPCYDWTVVTQEKKGAPWVLKWKMPHRATDTETVSGLIANSWDL